MNTNEIISAIDAEIAQLQKVKALLTDADIPAKRKPGRPAGSLSGATNSVASKRRKRRKMSAEGRAKIAAAQKARWASYKKATQVVSPAPIKSPVTTKPIAKKAVAKKKAASPKKTVATKGHTAGSTRAS